MAVQTLSTSSDAEEISQIADRIRAGHIVLDGYDFGDELEHALAVRNHTVVALDDFVHARHQYAHVVINQNFNARESDYPTRGPATRLLLGPRYALLRREFWSWRDRPIRRRDEARTVLVTAGGGDTARLSERVLEALHELPVSARLIVGPSNVRIQDLERRAAVSGVQVIVDPQDMPDHMNWADVAVSAAGSTCWELLFMGVPTIVAAVALNQRAVEGGLVEARAVQSLGWHEDVTPLAIRHGLTALIADHQTRRTLSMKGRMLIDGQGAERAVRLLADTAGETSLRVRPASAEDEYYVWSVNNQPLARRSAIQTEAIPYDTHVAWFSRSISAIDRIVLIAMKGDAPVGVVRFDRQDDEALISIALEEAQQGRGFGARLIALATKYCHGLWPLRAIRAQVRPDNVRSRRAFEKAAYRLIGSVRVNGVELEVFVHDVAKTGSAS